MAQPEVTPAPAAAPAAGAGAPTAQPSLPTEEQMLAHYDESKAAPAVATKANEPAPGATPTPAPEEDPDGDKGFEKEFKDFRMPDGLSKRIKTLTEQRNLTRTEAKELKGLKETYEKDYGFFKPYANEKGKQYLSTLVEFDGMLETAFENNPWLEQVFKAVVVEGQGTKAERAKVLALVQEAKEEAAEEAAGAPAAGATPDPRDKQLKDLMAWKEGQEAKERQSTEMVQRRKAIDSKKETYRAEIAEFHEKNPQFKEDKEFTRMALQVSAARGIPFTEAAKFISDYLGNREKSVLTKLAKGGEDRGGAAVETPGKGGVPVKARPAIGSDEEASEMEAYFAGGGG